MNNTNVMVCVTQQKTCERLILNGYKLLQSENDKLFVVHVVNEKGMFLDNTNDGESLEYLFNVSKKVGADLTVLRSKDVMETIVDFAKDNEITHIVIGARPENDIIYNLGFGLQLQESLPGIEFIIL